MIKQPWSWTDISRLQHTNLSQNLVDKFLDLATLVYYQCRMPTGELVLERRQKKRRKGGDLNSLLGLWSPLTADMTDWRLDDGN